MCEEKLYVTYPGSDRKYPAVKVKCSQCGIDVIRRKSHTKDNKKYFCSKECKIKYFGTKALRCVICGKQIKRKRSRLNSCKSKIFCCSLQCANEARRNGLIKCGPSKNPNKLLSKSIKRVYHHKLNNKCSVCGKPIGNNKYGMCRDCYVKSDYFKLAIKKVVNSIRNGKGYCGWHSRSMLSYPEKFFKKVLENNNIIFEGPNFTVKKRDIGVDEPNCYFLDFKIGMVDLEIYGSQHWQYKERIESDRIRDERLTKAGYTVYRIKWKNINTIEGKQYIKEEIDKLLQFLGRVA